MKGKQNAMSNKCANWDRRFKQQEKETVKWKNCGVFFICAFCAKDRVEIGKGINRWPFWENFPRKSKYSASCAEQAKYQGEIRSRSKNNNDSSIRAKLRKYTNVRVLQKNLVYVIGLSPELVLEKEDSELLKSSQYFGQYGILKKVVVNTNYVYKPKGSAGPSYGAYVTYSSPKEAALAILGIEQHELDNRLLRASFGTTKYCSFFLKEQKCLNKEWLYLHKWHSDTETYTKEEMASKKIFSDQQEIAIRLSQINLKSKEEYAKAYEKQYGKIPEDSRFPNILQIYEKFSTYDESKIETEQTTPKKVCTKAESFDSTKNLEETKSPSDLQASDVKTGNKLTKQEILQQKAQIDIEHKIIEANNIAISKEIKREGSGGNKGRNKISSPNKTSKIDPADSSRMIMHHNPHIQMKDSRLREGEDKRAISSGRHGNYTMPAHSPSARQPTTAEKYTLFGHSEDSTIWRTPQTNQAFIKPTYVVSPYFFNRNRESRFEFARSMDPKEETVCLNIPEEIQEILERNIRTMSNKAHKSSIDNTSSTADMIDFREDWNLAMDRLRLENERMLEFGSSRRSSPRNKQHRPNLSPRSELNKKSGSLNKRDGENYMIWSSSNQLYSRSSMHSYAEGVKSDAVHFKYDSESTSNNDFHPEHIKYGADSNIRPTRGRQ